MVRYKPSFAPIWPAAGPVTSGFPNVREPTAIFSPVPNSSKKRVLIFWVFFRYTVSLKINVALENRSAKRIILLYTKNKVKNNYITLQQKKSLRVFSKNVRILTSRAAPKLHRPPNWYYITLQQIPDARPIKLHTKPKIACDM